MDKVGVRLDDYIGDPCFLQDARDVLSVYSVADDNDMIEEAFVGLRQGLHFRLEKRKESLCAFSERGCERHERRGEEHRENRCAQEVLVEILIEQTGGLPHLGEHEGELTDLCKAHRSNNG